MSEVLRFPPGCWCIAWTPLPGKHACMPLDAISLPGSSNRYISDAVPSLDQAERNASVHFARLLFAQLASQPATNGAMVLLVKMTMDLEGTSVRLVHSGGVARTMNSGETALAWILQGVPNPAAKRRALVVRLASVAAGAWRQHCQIHRLGFLSA